MHVLYETLKQLAQAGIVYGVLILGYSQVSDAATCGQFITSYTSATYNGPTQFSQTAFIRNSTGQDPAACGAWIMSGAEYDNLIKSRIDAANTSITTLQGNQTTLQNNLTTVNTSLQTVADLTTVNKTRLDELEAFVHANTMRDENNILHISHEDALTLFYAVMGLFAVAFVWRFARNSLNVAETYTPAE